MVNVIDLMERNSFKRLKLLCARDGLYRRVSWPNVAQTPSIREWLLGGDVVIMTGVGLEITPEFWQNLVMECVEENAACLIVLLNEDLIREVPGKILEYAEKYAFPIFAAPWEIKIANIFKDIFQLIADDNYEDRMKAIFIEKIRDTDALLKDGSLCKLLNKYELTDWYSVVRIELQNYEGNIARPLQDLLGSISNRARVYYGKMLGIADGNQLSAFIPHLESEEVERRTKRLVKETLQEFPQLMVRAGISNRKCGTACMADAWEGAAVALRMCAANRVLPYRSLGIYQLLLEVPDQGQIRAFMRERIGKLIDSDATGVLLDTLQTYLDCNESMKDTAEKMFIHRNTLMKRLEKIKGILEFDFEDVQKKHEIYDAMKIWEFMKD